MIKAHWMLNGGKSEEDWNKLPLSTIRLLTVAYFAEEERQMNVFEVAIRKAFSVKRGETDG